MVHVVQRDGIILLMGSEQLCFLTFTLECKHPQAVVYKEKTDGEFICPWLYLPFTSSEESWIFHPIQLRDDESTFTCIPEINCVIPTRALRMHLNTSRTKKKTIALKMLWVGEDSKQRRGKNSYSNHKTQINFSPLSYICIIHIFIHIFSRKHLFVTSSS